MGLISAKSLFFRISTMLLFISTAAYFLFEAQTADECGLSFYVSITVMTVTVYTSKIAWKLNKIFKLIRNYEEFIDKSEF